MNRVGIGLVGTGFLAEVYARCYKRIPDAEVVAVFSKTEAHAKAFAEKYGVDSWHTDYEKMLKLDEVDCVNICLPNYLHAEATVASAEHGKHVLCTKPLATTLTDANKMLGACERAGVTLMYGENWLFTPGVARVRTLIAEGALGKLLAVEAREQHGGTHSPYATTKRFCGGGVLLHMAVHPIGLILDLMRRPVERVYAEIGNLLHEIEVEDYAVLLMRFLGGGSGIAQSNYITKGGMQDRVEVYGTEGMLFLDMTHVSPLRVYSDAGYTYVVEKASTSKGWTFPVLDETIQYGFQAMLEHFTQCLLENEESKATGEFGRKVLEVVFAGYESAMKKQAVPLDLKPKKG